jgi:hypothetical protein
VDAAVTATDCPGHDQLADELRQHALGALDLLEPWLAQVRDRAPDAAAPEPASCQACPVCALITVLRGGRSEFAVKLAQQATGLLAVLRMALAEGAGAPTPGPAGPAPGHGPGPAGAGPGGGDGAELPVDGRDVQRIPVTRQRPAPGEDAPSAPC